MFLILNFTDIPTNPQGNVGMSVNQEMDYFWYRNIYFLNWHGSELIGEGNGES